MTANKNRDEKSTFKPPEEQVRKDQKMQKDKSEKDIDKELKDSFPSSDPPSH